MTKRFPPATCSLLPLLWTMLIALNWSQAALTKACYSGWFGSNCQYKCRCNSKTCDRDGMCPGGVCQSGWFGPLCQYVDLVKNTSKWLSDGNENTCNSDQSLSSVTVNMGSELPFTWLRLQVKDPSLLQEFQVTFTDTRNESKISCKDLRNATVNETTLDIHCALGVVVQYVILRGGGVKSLCSLYISGGRNVALRQNTSQSTTYSDSEKGHSLITSAAENAVDGNTDRDWTHSSCTSTINGDNEPTWTVMLSLAHFINRYIVYNRDNIEHRIIGFTLRSFTKDGIMVFNYTDRERHALAVYTITNVPVTSPVSVVDIRTDNTNTVYQELSFCELELYGDSACQSSMYGRECQHKCNCAVEDESCFVSTGGCPSGCAAGYQGENCNKSCDFGKYGKGCNSDCSQFCVTTNSSRSPCRHTDGTCVHGCISGYQAPKCEHILMEDDDSFPVVAVVVPLVAAVILVVVVVVGVILWRRCRRTSDKQLSTVVNTDGNEDPNKYEQFVDKVSEPTNSHKRSEHVQLSTAVNSDGDEDSHHYELADDREPVPSNCHKRSEHQPAPAANRGTTPKQTAKNIVTENNSNENVYYNAGMSSN